MQEQAEAQGPKFYVDIEDTLFPWGGNTITTEQISELGGWDVSLGVQEINLKTNETRNLQAGEVVELKPGQGFAKKIKWKRG